MSTDQQAPARGVVGSYVYGILRAGRRIPDGLEPIPRGDEAGGLGLVTHGELAAVVSDIVTDKPLGTRRDLLAHEQVLNAIAQESAILPMRFGAVVTDDDAVAEELLAPHQDYFVRALESMEGLVQFSLRGQYDESTVIGRIVDDDPEIRRLRDAVAGVDEDAAYYDRIKLGEAISQAMDRLRTRDAQAAVDALSRYAVATAVKDVDGENGAVHVAFLVQRDHLTDFEQAVDGLGDEWDGWIQLRLVGPTAAFDFLPEYEAPEQGNG